MTLANARIFVSGGTGSLGHAFTRHVLAHEAPERVVLFSRDEHKHVRMAQAFKDDRLRFRLGDVRDVDRLTEAMDECDVVIHAAALKIIAQGLTNPSEMIRTNVIGTMHVLEAAQRVGAARVLTISSDK